MYRTELDDKLLYLSLLEWTARQKYSEFMEELPLMLFFLISPTFKSFLAFTVAAMIKSQVLFTKGLNRHWPSALVWSEPVWHKTIFCPSGSGFTSIKVRFQLWITDYLIAAPL